jgi:membrane-associated phospholipid phosphatase
VVARRTLCRAGLYNPAPTLASRAGAGRSPFTTHTMARSVRSITLPVPQTGTLRFAVAAAMLLVAAHLVDRWAFFSLAAPDVYGSDLGRLLRVMGFLPLWLLAALALAMHDWPLRALHGTAAALRRGLLLFGAAAASGIAGELLKLVFRRERPRMHNGEYVFRAWSERPFSSSGLGLPSSHAIVAFGAAAMLSYLFPRAWPIWWALAVGCALTRVAHGAHFVSDVAVSALVAVLVAGALWRRWGVKTGLEPRSGGIP